jgi:phage terminase large subunit-like protein
MSHVAAANRYIADVLSGEQPTCKWTRLACERQVRDLARQKEKGWPFRFDKARAERACRFMELQRHIKGEWAGQPVLLEPWQSFIYTTVFGWVVKAGPKKGARRFRQAYTEIPKKQGKSLMGSQVGLYLFAADREDGPEVYSAATTRDQAKIVWSTARLMCKQSSSMCKALGISIGAHALSIERTAGTFQALSADADNIEGKNPHGAIVDELHAHSTRLVLDNLLTAQGARRQPLMWIITTAGFNRHGVGYEQNSLARKVLEGTIADETLFAIIYTIDEGDDPFSEVAQRKANPNFEVSVSAEFLASQARLALQSSQFLPSYLTKHLDVWTTTDQALFDMHAWNTKCQDKSLSIEQFEGQEVHIGLDLASKTDLAAKVRLFQRQIEGVTHYYVFGIWYLPRAVVDDPRNSHYAGWEADGRLTVTDGDTIDMATIKRELFEDGTTFRVREIAYDPWQATQLAQELQAERVSVVEYRQNVANFSEPTKTLAALILDGRIHHNGDPALAWMMSNVVGHYDAKDNVYPRKEKPQDKIDGAIGLIMALGRILVRESPRSVYETRGLRVLIKSQSFRVDPKADDDLEW